MNNIEIKNIAYAIDLMQQISKTERSPMYSELLLKNRYALHHNCDHSVESDTIDTDVDNTLTIHYCKNCELTFDIQFFYDYFMDTLKNAKQQYWSISICSIVFPLQDFFIKNNEIVFRFSNNDNQVSLVSASLKELIGSRVDKSTIFL